MKSLTQFLEAQKFLVKGHTKEQGAVDLDLPSGTKWATCNIGANKPEDYGLLFQWGRIDGYKYKDYNDNFLSADEYVTTSGTKYKEDDTLNTEDDAAYQATKGKFRMPTVDEIKELIEHTNNEWTELNGVKGRKFISKKDNSKWIFIPASGCFDGYDLNYEDFGDFGYIWSSYYASNSPTSYYYMFYPGNCDNNHCERYSGDALSVRGVLNK